MLPGLTLTRTIPPRALIGILTGSYKVYGGVIRNNTGQIMAHLVNGFNPLSLAQSVLGGVNAYQLHRLGSHVTRMGTGVAELNLASAQMSETLGQVAQTVGVLGGNVAEIQHATKHLIALSTATMALPGLTLAISTAGFAFLNRKLNQVDAKLQELQKDVKELKDFLKKRERAELTTALNTLRDVSDSPNEDTRRSLLVNSRQALGTLHHYYRSQVEEAGTEGIISASEEYFAITAIAHALCAGELSMHKQAVDDLNESHKFWVDLCRTVAKEKLLRADPERFLYKRYADCVRTDEIMDWMDFAHDEEGNRGKGLEWIDELRAKLTRPAFFSINWSLSDEERREVELLRRLVSRNRIFKGYCSQLEYLKEHKLRPSSYQHEIEQLDNSQMIGDPETSGAYLLIATGSASSEERSPGTDS